MEIPHNHTVCLSVPTEAAYFSPVELSILATSYLAWGRIMLIMTPLPAKVTAGEKRGAQYQVIVQISPKYRGSFNTLAFGEIKLHSGSLKGWPS
ncbi:MAG TPA: hypothetical protein VFO40_27940 [Chthoniobacterales bacterium]|nr:hypothetical protein [Chthoniobacterales bacterium]